MTKDLESVGRRIGEDRDRVVRGESRVNGLKEVREGKRVMEEVNEGGPRVKEMLGKMEELRGERMNLLARLEEDIQTCKDNLERKGGEMSDSGVVVSLREGIRSLKSESLSMELELGTLLLKCWGGDDAAEKSGRYRSGEEGYIGVDLEASDDALGGGGSIASGIGSIASGMESLAS